MKSTKAPMSPPRHSNDQNTNAQDLDSMMDQAVGLIRRGAFGEAETVLQTLASRSPDDHRVLFHLGSLRCEQGRPAEAWAVLKRLTRAAPDFADGWNALGVALFRGGRRKEAEKAFYKALALNPTNGYILRNLGALMARRHPEEALPYLRRATRLLPSDQSALYAYAKGLMDAGRAADADRALKKAIVLNERSEIADLCREARIDILRKGLKGKIPRGLNREVVVFCLAALETFRSVERERARAVVFELASIGNRGLDIRDRTSRLRLLSLPGEFTPLQLVVYMYVGLKKTDPKTDPGIDYAREYAFALSTLPRS